MAQSHAVVCAEDVLRLPTEPNLEDKRGILDEYLHNPFLDDDVSGLALRLDCDRVTVETCVVALIENGLLHDVGRRGYALAPEGLAPTDTLPACELSPEAQAALTSSASGDQDDAPRLGVILLRADGQPELVDELAAQWLGLPREELDSQAFHAATGVDPTLMLGGAPKLTFTLDAPRPLAVAMHACCLGADPGVLIVLQDAEALTDADAVVAYQQEQLFGRLRDELVEPMMLVQHFLDNPSPDALGQARTALEQVNGFLEEFYLKGGERRRKTD